MALKMMIPGKQSDKSTKTAGAVKTRRLRSVPFHRGPGSRGCGVRPGCGWRCAGGSDSTPAGGSGIRRAGFRGGTGWRNHPVAAARIALPGLRQARGAGRGGGQRGPGDRPRLQQSRGDPRRSEGADDPEADGLPVAEFAGSPPGTSGSSALGGGNPVELGRTPRSAG